MRFPSRAMKRLGTVCNDLSSSAKSARVTQRGQYLRPVHPPMTASVISVPDSVPVSPTWSARAVTAALLIRGTSTAGRAASSATVTSSTRTDPPAMRWDGQNHKYGIKSRKKEYIYWTLRDIRARTDLDFSAASFPSLVFRVCCQNFLNYILKL